MSDGAQQPQWRVEQDASFQLRSDLLAGAIGLLMDADHIASDPDEIDEVLRSVESVYARAEEAGPLSRLLALGAIQAATLMPDPSDGSLLEADGEEIEPLAECLLDRAYDYLASLFVLERAEAQLPYLGRLDIGSTIPADNGHGVFFSLHRGARRSEFSFSEHSVDVLPKGVREMTIEEINVPDSPRWLGSEVDELPVTEVRCSAKGSKRVIYAFFDADWTRVG